MKLSPEQNAGLDKMARYFKEIETMADQMQHDEDAPRAFERKLSHLKVTARRRQIFKAYRNDEINSSIVNLNVIINEEKF